MTHAGLSIVCSHSLTQQLVLVSKNTKKQAKTGIINEIRQKVFGLYQEDIVLCSLPSHFFRPYAGLDLPDMRFTQIVHTQA